MIILAEPFHRLSPIARDVRAPAEIMHALLPFFSHLKKFVARRDDDYDGVRAEKQPRACLAR